MTDLRGLLRRGLNRPEKIPRYLFGLLHPSDRWGPEWRERDGAVVFEPGGYVSSPRTRPEFASNLYREVSGLRSILDDHLEHPVGTSLEVGSGYGRLSPWIAEYADAHYGVDPDGRALALASTHFPELGFVRGRAEALPFPEDAVDLVVTWTVLQHADDDSIRDATAEIARVLAPGGLAVCCERVRTPTDDHLHPRSVETYERLFAPLERRAVYERPVEPTWDDAMATERPAEAVLVFGG